MSRQTIDNNKQNAPIAAIILMAALVIMTGCSKTDGTFQTYNPHTGTDGMTISFAKNNPPAEIYEGNNFQVTVDAKNNGASDVSSGILLLGYEDEIAAAENQKESIDLYGRSTVITKGEEKFVNFRMQTKKLPPQVEVIESLLSITSCFDYKTIFSQQACVDTDPLSQRIGEKNCKAADLSSSGQGAPIAITKVQVEMLPHQDPTRIKPSFKITIQNKGKGTLFNKDKIEDACSSMGIEKNDLNTLYVSKAVLSNNYALDCQPKTNIYGPGYIKLKEGESEIRCTYEQGIPKESSPFLAPLIIELEYGYTQTISNKFKVKKEVLGT